MNVLLINVDSVKIPNIALEKIRLYHEQRGDVVYADMPMMAHFVDRIYVSVVFSQNKAIAEQYEQYDYAHIGGTGYDINKRLPVEIDQICPRINIGFVTRGCIRQCPFCVVPEKEGLIYQEAFIEDIWDGKGRKVTLLDNNILADKFAFDETCEFAIKHKLEIDFNQGLDYRLLDDESCRYLKQVKHRHWKFAWDNIKEESAVKRSVSLLHGHGIKNNTWYVLVGYNSTFEEDLYRVNTLRELGESVFVMRYGDCHYKRQYIRLAQWTALHAMFKKMSFEQFCAVKENKAQVKQIEFVNFSDEVII